MGKSKICKTPFPKKIRTDANLKSVGGRVYDDYLKFEKQIEYINENYFEFFSMLGFTNDLDLMIKVLNTNFSRLKYFFRDKILSDIESGKTSKSLYLGAKSNVDLDSLSPEERNKMITIQKRVINRKIFDEFESIQKNYKLPETRHDKRILRLCRNALVVTLSGIEINIPKFAEIYIDFVAADESVTKKLHQRAADAMNRFFNSSVKITLTEFFRYFTIESGMVEINPDSVNGISYARLGRKTTKVIKY